MMRLGVWLPLYTKDGVIAGQTLIDWTDAIWAESHAWRLSRNGHGHFYVWRGKVIDGKFRHIYLHRAILGLDPREQATTDVDHINHDTLDNRRANLRSIPHNGNQQNQRPQLGRTSRYRGVYFERWTGRWRASAQKDRVTYRLGRFDSEDKAAAVVSEWRRINMPYSVEVP